MPIVLPLISSTLVSAGAAVAYFFWPKNTLKFAPCAFTETSNILTDTNAYEFILPNSNKTCNTSTKTYNMIYFSPKATMTQSQFFTTEAEPYSPKINGITQDFQVFSPTKLNAAIWPNNGSNNVSVWIPNFKSPDRTLSQYPLNATPNYVGSSDAITISSATSLPWNENGSRGPPIVWILPGANTGNALNFPTDGITQALTTILYIYAVQDASLYLELGGARGGSYTVYSNGANPETGVSAPIEPGFVGGSPGIVYGLYYVKKGDVLKVFLGSKGETRDNASGSLSYGGAGQGGLATVFAGANGGGASYIYHYVCADFINNEFDALTSAVQNKPSASLVCVAGGGGGASRNASGGYAGLCETPANPLYYGGTIDTSTTGSAGGLNNITGPAPLKLQVKPNNFSGGGGGVTIGGISNVPDQTPEGASNGTKIELFQQNCGGGSVITSKGSGGGGGGGGIFGGGAGGWNSLAKPNNLHGAGGGGASSRKKLQNVSKPTNVCFNIYRGLWDTQGRIWNSTRENSDGYLVIGLATA